MRILSIESSAKACSVAAMENGKIIAHYFHNSALTHSRTLIAMADDMLKSLEMTMADIDAVAVAVGPGSFTGVRIGVAAAKGLAWGADKPVCAVSTLHAMAWQLPYVDGIVCPVMDARRSQVYNALFEIKDGKPVRLCEDRAISLAELIAEAKESGKTYFLVGDGAEMCYNNFLEAGVSTVLAPEMLRMQSAWGVSLAAVDCGIFMPADDVEPNYLRLSQAERERLERGQKI